VGAWCGGLARPHRTSDRAGALSRWTLQWIAANIRPNWWKAIVNVEGGGLILDKDKLTALTDIPVDTRVSREFPIVYVTAEKSGRTQGPACVAFLKQAGLQRG